MGSASLKINEPSMEEILASIRRIIADDQETMHAPEAEEPDSSPLRNVLDLTERHVSPILYNDLYNEALGQHDADRDEVTASQDLSFEPDNAVSVLLNGYKAEQPASPSMAENKPAPGPAQIQVTEGAPGEPLLSSMAQASVSDAFNRLGSALMPSHPQTLEDLMKEMLRPMLKTWLDDNLPPIVERLVQAEIDRVTRGRA
jgi:cell pole-organizing protein PopZ